MKPLEPNFMLFLKKSPSEKGKCGLHIPFLTGKYFASSIFPNCNMERVYLLANLLY